MKKIAYYLEDYEHTILEDGEIVFLEPVYEKHS